jgi:hypothetical protein
VCTTYFCVGISVGVNTGACGVAGSLALGTALDPAFAAAADDGLAPPQRGVGDVQRERAARARAGEGPGSRGMRGGRLPGSRLCGRERRERSGLFVVATAAAAGRPLGLPRGEVDELPRARALPHALAALQPHRHLLGAGSRVEARLEGDVVAAGGGPAPPDAEPGRGALVEGDGAGALRGRGCWGTER